MSLERQEILRKFDFGQIGIEALTQAFNMHEALGAEGENMIEKNQYGETALTADVQAEKAVLDTLWKIGLPVIVQAEEHGLVRIGDGPAILLAVLDGIDGSDEYKRRRGKGRYGTMFGIFANTDPTYNDYLFQGIIEPATNTLYYAVKGKGAFVRTTQGMYPIHTAATSTLDAQTRIYFSENDFDTFGADKNGIIRAVSGIPYTRLNSTASHYADLASGKIDLVIEPTRKGNLEPAAAYGLVAEAGGDIITFEGESLGTKRFKEYGQRESRGLIAGNNELVMSFLQRM